MTSSIINVLHLTYDNPFIEKYVIPNISEVSGKFGVQIQHKIIAWNTKDKSDLKNLNLPISFGAKINSEKFNHLVGNIQEYDAVIIHFLHNELAEYLLKIPKNIKVYWVFYGGDFFNPQRVKPSLIYLEETLSFFYKEKYKKIRNTIIRKNIFAGLSNYFKIRSIRKKEQKNFLNALKRINYICHFNQTEIDLVKSLFNYSGSVINFNYSKLSSQIDFGQKLDKPTRKKVLLGGNGSMTNNHLDGLTMIMNAGYDGEIICPLSYAAESQEYINTVILHGHNLFKDRFKPITTLLPMNEYIELIQGCCALVLPSLRLNAGHSITQFIYHGTPVFTNENSTLYQEYKRLGITLFPFTKFNLFLKGELKFSDDEKESNRKNYTEYFNDEVVLSRYSKLLASMLDITKPGAEN